MRMADGKPVSEMIPSLKRSTPTRSRTALGKRWRHQEKRVITASHARPTCSNVGTLMSLVEIRKSVARGKPRGSSRTSYPLPV